MDFFFESHAPLNLGSNAQKFAQNMEAVRILKTCETEKRPAAPDEQATLSRYVGWGAADLLNKLVKEPGDLSADELAAAKASALNAHYTALPVIGAIWNAVTHLGISGPEMSILDPSAGIGHFKSIAPETLRAADWTEIELDDLTARILRLLHPASRVYSQGYETTYLPENRFDLVISNVPFGNYGVGRSTQKLPRFVKSSIHDFFFANSVALLRPGGVLALITSRYTLDKQVPRFRAWLAERMDLLAAVRLPYTAFKDNAGTEVVTDILFLQKREALRMTDDPAPTWLESERIILHNQHGYGSFAAHVNRYYLDHPEMILGKQISSGKMYRRDSYNVEPDEDDFLDASITQALLKALPAGVGQRPITIPAEVETATPADQTPVILTDATARNARDKVRLEQLHEIYQTAKQLLAAETRGETTVELRQQLNAQYDEFVSVHGLINSTAITRLLRSSVEGPFLQALEISDETGTRKADIFYGRLVRQAVVTEDPTPGDALLISLDRQGKVDLEFIAAQSKTTVDVAVEQLGDRIYQLPSGGWEVADAYLSGNIPEKLAAAKGVAEFDPAFQRNVAGLTAVLPEPIPAADIRVPLGAGWIPVDIIVAFLEHLLTDAADFSARYTAHLAQWVIDVDYAWRIPKTLSQSKWGTPRLDAFALITLGLNAKMPVVWDGVADDRKVNQTETVAAQSKLADIKKEFETWLWRDPDRAQRLTELYNHTYNAFVVRQYDGSHLSIPGLNQGLTLRPGQKNAIWRIAQNPATLLWHDVGYGKTLSGIVSALESKRLGLTHKAMLVVPNHLVGQWQASALTAYPNANILAATPQRMRKENRGAFLSSIATNDWDLVIMPYSSFKLLPVHPDTEAQFFQQEIDTLEEYLYELKEQAGDDASAGAIKDIEKAKKRFEEKLDKLANMPKDAVGTITWEELGIDFLCVDEFHNFKNLFYATKMTRIAGLSNANSQRAFDMYLKSRWIMAHGGKFVGLTGTPITNSIAEMFTMMRYFMPDILVELGLSHFDAWAQQFALAEPGLEMTPDGAGFRMNTRFRSFVNVPELLHLFFQVTDRQKVDAKSGIERPGLYQGGPVKVVVSGGEELTAFTDSLADRAERIRRGLVKPHEDNMLLITGEGRKAALDLSLVVPAVAGAPMPKIDALCDNIAAIYAASAPVQGAQLVFCDLATPKPAPKANG